MGISMGEKRVFNSKRVAATGAPYSQAVIVGDLVFVSGQVALDPASGKIVTCTFKDEVTQLMNNLKRLLEEMGISLQDVVKVTVFLKDMEKFQQFNEIYKGFFLTMPPARSCVEVSNLPLGANIEIEVIACLLVM